LQKAVKSPQHERVRLPERRFFTYACWCSCVQCVSSVKCISLLYFEK